MKRLIGFVLTAILVIAAAVSFSAVSVADGGAIFTMNDVDGIQPGESFDITLSISGEYAVHGMNLSIEYDPTAMVLDSCTQGEFLSQVSSQGNLVLLDATKFANAGMIKLGIICPVNAISSEGEVMTMRFHVKDGVTVNQQVIMVVNEFVYMPLNQPSSPVEFTTDNAIITLVSGATPPGGYNDGDHGVGDNTSAAPQYPTRDPSDPDANTTPFVEATPVPTELATPSLSAAPASAAPAETAAPDASAAPGGQRETAEPDATEAAAADESAAPKPTEPTRDGEDTAATQAPGQEHPEPGKSTNVLPIIIIGAAVVLAAVAAVLVIRGRKRS